MKSLRVFPMVLVSLAVVLPTSLSANWSYTGEHNPHRWGESGEYALCGTGKNQSPIDITGAQYDPQLGEFSFSGWDSDPGQTWTIKNNGHSATLYVAGGISTSQGGLPAIYDVLQFHFHWGSVDSKGSEHTVNGERFPMEMHIVHGKHGVTNPQNTPDGLAVLGVFFEISDEDNANLKPVIDSLVKIKDAGSMTSLPSFVLSSLLPSNTKDFYRYQGSLTTPACNEVVVWTLLKEKIQISANQLGEFRALMDSHGHALEDNFRPIQALNGRDILASFDG